MLSKSVRGACTAAGHGLIDLYQIHRPDPTTPIQESMEAVAQLIEEGKVRYAGVSNYNAAQMAEAEKYITLVSNQVPYSMVLRDIEAELVPYTLKHKKSILAYSPLQRGLLTGKMQPGHQFAEGDHRKDQHYFSEENIKRAGAFLEKIKPLADEKNATLSQLVILWTVLHSRELLSRWWAPVMPNRLSKTQKRLRLNSVNLR